MAPDSRARSTSSRWLNAVSITTGATRSRAIWAAAAMPSSRGILTSITTRSGRCSIVSATACSPSPASATTSYPASVSISARSSLISASSSAITTRFRAAGAGSIG